MNICPPLDYKPDIYPINAEYQIKSNWDSLKVGMSQKKVREWMKFDPMITYNKNKIKYWEYNKFGTLEFDDKGRLLNPDNDKVKDKPLQKRIISAKKAVRNVLGNMIDSRIKYLTEEHIDYGIENYKEIGE